MNSYLVCVVYLFVSVFAQNFQKELYEGDDCDLSYNEKGICVRLSLCPSAIEIVQQKQHPKRCGFVRSIPIVCCSKTQVKITRLAEQKCKTFQTSISVSSLPYPSNLPSNNKPFSPSFLPNQGGDPPIIINTSNKNFETAVTAEKDYPRTQQRYDSFKPERNSYNNSSQYDTHKDENINVHTPPLQHMPSIMNDKGTRAFNETFENMDETLSSEFKPDFHKFVIGGVNAVVREFPHMAALGYTNNKNKVWLCGGSLVSEQYVLTAAHCLYSKDYGPLEWVRLGELNLASAIDQSIPEDYKVVNKIAHPLYKAPSVYHDIALVQLDRYIEITNYVKPACLFTQEYIPPYVTLWATGWGLTNVGGKQSDILQKVDLDIFTEQECDQTYRNLASTRRLLNGILHRQQICVGERSKEKDTCQGDSGGPLQIKVNDDDGERFYIVGVTSFGRSCAIPNIPGIYTRVSYYIPWIESVLWPNEK